MEEETGRVGVDTRSGMSPPFFQHQFFPTNGIQPSHANNVGNMNGRRSSADDYNIGEGSIFPRHWDMKNWKWDPIEFAAQRADGRGEGPSEDLRQFESNGNGGSHTVSDTRITTDGPSSRGQPDRCNEEDERENIGRSVHERETPSPPFNDEHSLSGDDDSQEAVGSLLKLGGDAYAYTEGNACGSRNGKRNRSSSPQYQVPTCQVDACKADLSKTKDYYRRHKVCEMHSKATRAPVSRLMQRFCQQCSRFHLLEEFDEGKRSCRRRLDGHNRRRRKTQPDADAARAYIMAEEERLSKGSPGLIGSLLNILSQLTGATSLDRVNAPVFDREALLRKAIAASLEDINRTTPLWAQLLTNPNHLTSALGQQAQQLAVNNGHGLNVAMEAQHLLSRLTGPSPEHLIALLQNSLSSQIAAASMTIQNNLGSQMHGAIGSGHIPIGSTSGSEAQAARPCTIQTCVAPTSAGVSQSFLSSPMPGRATPVKEVLRPTPVAPMSLPQLNSEQSIHYGVPATQSLFTPYQAPPNKKQARGAATSSHLPSDGRIPPTIPFMGNREPPANVNGLSSGARGERDARDPVQQSSGNSQSGSDEQQPSSSNARVERRNQTRRIAMKLFERNPDELPGNLRSQIDSWLAHLPSDMESYIRPGCLVLSIFVSMPTCGWTELDTDLQGSVQKLLDLCKDDFWHRGRVLVQVERQMVLVVDGKIQENRLVNSWGHPYIQSVRPLAVEAGQAATITIKGFNLTPPDTRVLCAHQGKYLLQESVGTEGNQVEDTSCDTDEDGTDKSIDYSTLSIIDETSLNLDAEFTLCGELPHAMGRCFLEVEYDTTLANARPLIIADRLVCSELCTLEDEVELAASCTTQAAVLEGLQPVEVLGCSQAMRLVVEEDIASFLHELGWYFQSGIYRQKDDSFSLDVVTATRLKCLLIFSVERSWCAVVRKLFDITLTSQDIDTGIARLSQVVQDDHSLLHRAVRRKNRDMVELLLAYIPSCITNETIVSAVDIENLGNLMQFKLQWGKLFRPDMTGPAGLTPLHIAASMQDGEDIVDALTSDPLQVGLHAWVNKRDESGQTPLHCAVAGNNLRSLQLVKDKLTARQGGEHQVFIDIPPDSLFENWAHGSPRAAQGGGGGPSVQLAEWVDNGSASVNSSSINKGPATCRIHARRAHFGGISGRGFRPFILSLVAIAMVCVCVCVVIRSPPNVQLLMRPFLWEGLESGQI